MKSLIAGAAFALLIPSFAQAGNNLYFGGYTGYGSTSATATVSGTQGSASLGGGRLGGFAGADFGIGGGVVIGVEGDLSYDWNKASATAGGFTGNIGTNFGASARSKVGYNFGAATVFVAGGLTAANAYATVTGLGSVSQWVGGYTVGGGADFNIMPGTFVRAEYRYNNYGRIANGASSVDFHQNVFNAGLGVRF